MTGGKGIGIIIVVIAGIAAAAFYFLKGKIGAQRKRPSGVMGEKRHISAKSQQEIKMGSTEKKIKKGKACWRAYRIEGAAATNMQEGIKAQDNLAACLAVAQK